MTISLPSDHYKNKLNLNLANQKALGALFLIYFREPSIFFHTRNLENKLYLVSVFLLYTTHSNFQLLSLEDSSP